MILVLTLQCLRRGTCCPISYVVAVVKKKKILIILNRKSGDRSYVTLSRQICRELWAWEKDYHICSTVEETRKFRDNLDESQYHCCIVLGGDGTINSILKRKGKSDLPLICLPLGTANDISSALGLSLNMTNLADLVSNIKNSTEYLDILTVNREPFISTAGVGISTFVLAEYNSHRNHYKSLSNIYRVFGDDIYKLLALKSLMYKSRKSQRYRISWDGQTRVINGAYILITNQPNLGNNLMVAPSAKLNDGKFNVLVGTHSNTKWLINDLLSMTNKNVPKSSLLIETDNLKVETLDGSKINYFADGEVVGNSNLIEFGVRPKAQAFALNRIVVGES